MDVVTLILPFIVVTYRKIGIFWITAYSVVKNITVAGSYHLLLSLPPFILALLKTMPLHCWSVFQSQGHLLLSVLYELSLENNKLYVGQIAKHELQRIFPLYLHWLEFWLCRMNSKETITKQYNLNCNNHFLKLAFALLLCTILFH